MKADSPSLLPTRPSRPASVRPRGQYVLAPIASGLLLGVGGLLAMINPSGDWVLIAGTALMLIALAVARRATAGRIDLFEPLVVFIVAWAILFVARPLMMMAYGDFALLGYETRSGFDEMLVMALIGGIAFGAGYLIPYGATQARRLNALPSIATPSITVWYAVALAVVGVALFAIFLSRIGLAEAMLTLLRGRTGGDDLLYGQSTAYLYMAPLLLVPASLLLISIGLERQDRWLTALGGLVIAPVIVETAATGTRSSLLPIVASIWILPYLRKGRRPRALTVSIIALVTLVLGVGFVGNARNASTRESVGFGDALRASVERPDRGVKQLLETGDTEMAPLLAIITDAVPATYEHMRGAATGEVFVHWVPRSLWPTKPRQGDDVMTRRLFVEPGISIAPRQYTPMANFYLDFGLLGVGVGMFMLGVIGRAHYAYFCAHARSATNQMLYAATLPFWIVLLRGNITDTVSRLFFIVPPLLLGIYLARPRQQGFAGMIQTPAATGRTLPTRVGS